MSWHRICYLTKIDIRQDASSITLTPALGCSTRHLLIITGLYFCQFCFWGYYLKEGQRHPDGNDVAFSGQRERRVSLCSYGAGREEVLEWWFPGLYWIWLCRTRIRYVAPCGYCEESRTGEEYHCQQIKITHYSGTFSSWQCGWQT